MNKEHFEPIARTVSAAVKKYRWALLILLLGAVLLLWPQKKTSSETKTEEPKAAQADELAQTEQKLSAILSQMEGAGSVQVMLSVKTNKQTIYQTDKKTSTESSGGSEETTTVMATQTGADKTPVEAATQGPVYQGAVVLCQGADSAGVRLAIVEAVSDLTGLGSEKISVIKMKRQ